MSRLPVFPILVFFTHLIGVPSALAADGFEIARRHPVLIEAASSLVLGNGAIGCRPSAATESECFLKAQVVGEHWLFSEEGSDSETASAKRVPLADLSVRVGPSASFDGASALRLADGADYSLSEGVLSNQWETDSGRLAADLTVAPTQNVVFFSVTSEFPVPLSFEVTVPPETMSAGSSPSLAVVPSGTASRPFPVILQELPEGESYGIASIATSASVSASTREQGWRIDCAASQRFECAFCFTEPEEGQSLFEATVDQTTSFAQLEPSDFAPTRSRWWPEFWGRSLLDLTGSEDPRAEVLERLWVGAHHALAVHARGMFPPDDSGYWLVGADGHLRRDTLWFLYGGWCFSSHGEDIRCLSYPLSMGSEEAMAQSGGSLDKSLPELFHPVPGPKRYFEGFFFSSIPLLAVYGGSNGGTHHELAAVYPYLRSNANAAMEILSSSRERELPAGLVPHLHIAIQVALETARSLRVDTPAAERWQDCLDRLDKGSQTPASLLTLSDSLEAVEGGVLSASPEETLRWLVRQSPTPEGILLTEAGVPSLVKTGAALRRILELVFSDRGGVIRFLPGIPSTGDWSVRLERLNVPSGFSLLSLTMRRGVVDPFLLQSHLEGVCRLELPMGWKSARVALVGGPSDVPEVELRPEPSESPTPGGTVVSFNAKGEGVYLVGPVW